MCTLTCTPCLCNTRPSRECICCANKRIHKCWLVIVTGRGSSELLAHAKEPIRTRSPRGYYCNLFYKYKLSTPARCGIHGSYLYMTTRHGRNVMSPVFSRVYRRPSQNMTNAPIALYQICPLFVEEMKVFASWESTLRSVPHESSDLKAGANAALE